ncbi:MAG: hypothetical protein WC528_01735 [Patescibacteria group bacterium]
MFETTPKSSDPLDMFEVTPKSPAPPNLPAEKNTAVGSRLPEELLDEVMEGGSGKGKKIILVILGVIILAGLVFGGYILYNKYFGAPSENENISNISNQAGNKNITIPPADIQALALCYLKEHADASFYFPAGLIRGDYEKAAANAAGCASFSADELSAIFYYFTLDPDQDGLNYVVEQKYGTDNSKKDTDGDSYGDLVEINGGYNPLGPGKL